MRKRMILTLGLCLLAACGAEPTSTPDLVATQIAIEIAAHATMTAMVPTATATPEPTATPTATDTLTPTPLPSDTPTPGPTATPPPIIEAEEYAVYSALIEQNPVGSDLGSPVVIRDETTVWDADLLERALEQSPPLPAFLVDSYRSRNAASYKLSPNLDLEQDYTLIREEESQEILRHGGTKWDEFRASYPGTRGMVKFSRVGFSEEEDTALVLMGFTCDDLCGAGGLYLLAKEDGSWIVQDALMIWIS